MDRSPIATEALITRLTAHSMYAAYSQLVRTSDVRHGLLVPDGDRDERGPLLDRELIVRAFVENTQSASLFTKVAPVCEQAFACELERGLLFHLKADFAGLGEFRLDPFRPVADISFVSVIQRASVEPNVQAPPTSSTGGVAAAVAHLAPYILRRSASQANLTPSILGEVFYQAFVAAIDTLLSQTGLVSLRHIGRFTQTDKVVRFTADPLFSQIIGSNLGQLAI